MARKPWLQYITINGYDIPYPNDFEPQKVPNIVNEMQTLTGKTVADINGWNLLAAIADNEFQISFKDIDGADHTVNAVFKGRANVKTPMFHKGVTVWRDVSVQLSFPDCYED